MIDKYRINSRGESGFGKTGLILTLPFIAILIAYLVYQFFLIPEPVVIGTEDFKYLAADKTISLQGENLKSINITIYQSDKIIELLDDTPETGEKTYSLQIKPRDHGLKDGSATIVLKAKSGFVKEITQEISSVIDTKPPSLSILRAPSLISHGSGGFAAFSVKGADSVVVRAGDYRFRAFKAQPDDPHGEQAEVYESQIVVKRPRKIHETYYAFIPAPFDLKKETQFYAVAKDVAGNQSIRALHTRLKAKKQKESTIEISDSFINRVISPLLNVIDIPDPAEAFKKINEDWREKAHKKIFEIARKTGPSIIWKGRFLQLRNSKVMAGYGEKRTYIYKGRKISSSSHLGYDLASIENAPVEAANTGIIVFAGDLGIYGNTVIIDHGLGLMSLYGHLSSLLVEEGQAVTKGETIALTGATGLAGGDHLHFGMLMHGHEVSPLYWWDSRWIKVNITDYLK